MQTILDEIDLLTIRLYYAAFDIEDDRLARAFLIAIVTLERVAELARAAA